MAGETYAQRKNAILRQVRSLKRTLTVVNTALEIVRREADRLSNRKTIITPDVLLKLGTKWTTTLNSVNGVATVLQALIQLARAFL